VVADRVVFGRSDIPEMKQAAGILFYINEKKQLVEMVSVSTDGRLWRMSGPLGGKERTTSGHSSGEGRTGLLR
jgi:hypothetical protein